MLPLISVGVKDPVQTAFIDRIVAVPVYRRFSTSYSRRMWKVAKDEVVWDRMCSSSRVLFFTSRFHPTYPASCQFPLHTLSWPWGLLDPSVRRLGSLTQRGKMHVCMILLGCFFLAAADDQCRQHCGQGYLQKRGISSRGWAAVEGCLRVHRLQMAGERLLAARVPRRVVHPIQEPHPGLLRGRGQAHCSSHCCSVNGWVFTSSVCWFLLLASSWRPQISTEYISANCLKIYKCICAYKNIQKDIISN